MTEREPTRIVDDGASDLGSLLSGLSTADLGSEFDVAAAADRFDASLPPADASPPPSPPSSGGMGLGMKLVVAAFVFGLAGVGMWAVRNGGDEPRPEPTTDAEVEPPESPAAAPEPELEQEPEEVEASEEVEEPVPVEAAEPETPVEPTPKTKPKAPPKPVPDEITLAADMKKAFDRKPARALELARQGEKHYPDGMFARERQAYIALSLQALGKEKKAKAAAEAFLNKHPKGVLADRIRRDVLGE